MYEEGEKSVVQNRSNVAFIVMGVWSRVEGRSDMTALHSNH